MTALEEASRNFMEAANRLPQLFSLDDGTTEILMLLHQMQEGTDEPELVERLAEVEAFVSQKIEGCAVVVRELESLAAYRKLEADRLRDQAKRLDTAAERLRTRVLEHMKATGKDKVVTPRFTLAVRQNPWHVDILEERMVPARFKELVTTVHIDKKAILKAITKDGEVVDGVSVSRGERLAIS